MKHDDALVDQIVRDVMQQLRTLPEAKQSPGAAQPVVLHERVITEELLEQQLNGAKRIEVGTKSVLTPSARDFLSQQKIEWQRQPETKSTTQTHWKAIVVQSTSAVTAALNDLEQSTQTCWNQEITGTTCEAVSAAVSAICRAEADGVVIFTGKPESVACRANRNLKVRAAVLGDVRRTESIKTEMGVNLFCINPDGKTYIELRNLLRAVTSGSTPRVPENWNELTN
ncbi:MAG: hypothetical protein IH899_09175 [Planctomycetes bacterium]|nr:hypothetical protein [Planctomycetota bacterium]